MQFHYVFTMPVLFLLSILVWKNKKEIPSVGFYGVGALCLIAMVYTTPWDNYLVYKGIWSYGSDRVLAVIGYVPFEEYLFFIFQTLISGFLCLYVLCVLKVFKTTNYNAKSKKINMSILIILWLFSFSFLFFKPTLYMGLILTWALPVMILQWYFGYNFLVQNLKLVFSLIMVPTIYLWFADWVAIDLMNIWTISESFTIGIYFFGLPIEEMVFFLVTNIMVVQGLTLLLHPECQKQVFKRELKH